MDMSTMTMAATTTAMDMASSTMSMDMTTSTAMSSTDTMTTWMDMSEMGMSMTFFTSTATPLYSMSWMPANAGQYAGTCIFLIAFATLFRAILAMRINFFEVMAVVKNRRGENTGLLAMDKGCEGGDKYTRRPWRMNEAVLMGCADVVLAGMSYLLMIAVMTMNVGYFLSVLAGVFLGSVIFAHLMAHSAAH